MSTWCLIPAAGKSTRMQPLTHSLPKAMLPVAGKPLIYHIIDKVRTYNITNFVIITGYLKKIMEEKIKMNYPELNICFVEQVEQEGLGHACLLGEKKIQPEEPLLIIYGDTLFEANLRPILKSKSTHIGVYPVEDPRNFGVITKDNNGNITNFVEKPEVPPSNLAIAGVNFFHSSGELFEAIHYIIKNKIKKKGEYQITDAFSYMIREKNLQLKYFMIDNWYDCGTLKNMLISNQYLLEMKDHRNIIKNIQNSKVIEPVYIVEGAKIIDSILGPYVSIGKNSLIQNSIISSSIVDENTSIINSTAKNSLIGQNVQLNSMKGEFILGDHSRLNISFKV